MRTNSQQTQEKKMIEWINYLKTNPDLWHCLVVVVFVVVFCFVFYRVNFGIGLKKNTNEAVPLNAVKIMLPVSLYGFFVSCLSSHSETKLFCSLIIKKKTCFISNTVRICNNFHIHVDFLRLNTMAVKIVKWWLINVPSFVNSRWFSTYRNIQLATTGQTISTGSIWE